MIHHVVPGGRYGRNGTGGYCRHVYVGYVERCTITVFLNCDEEAFRFLCGTFVEALYDNIHGFEDSNNYCKEGRARKRIAPGKAIPGHW
jgi:hypothetical protein